MKLTSALDLSAHLSASLAPNLSAIFSKAMHLHFPIRITPSENSIGLSGSPLLQILSTEVWGEVGGCTCIVSNCEAAHYIL